MSHKKLFSTLLGTALVSTLLSGPGATPAQAKDAAGNLRYTIQVGSFENKAGWSGRWSIGDGFGSIMTEALHASENFIVIAEQDMRNAAMREQDFAASGRTAGGKKAPKIGRVTPAQLLVKGVITHVQGGTSGKSGGFSIRGISIGKRKDQGEVNITLYLIDTETAQVKASTKVVGKAGGKGLKIGIRSPVSGGRMNMGSYERDNVGKACEDAVGQGVEFLTSQLEDIAWTGSIVMADASKIVINRGTREGVADGMVFEVGTVEELVDPDTGEVLDREMTTLGELEVTKVKEKIAYCKSLTDGAKFAKGMEIHPQD